MEVLCNFKVIWVIYYLQEMKIHSFLYMKDRQIFNAVFLFLTEVASQKNHKNLIHNQVMQTLQKPKFH